MGTLDRVVPRFPKRFWTNDTDWMASVDDPHFVDLIGWAVLSALFTSQVKPPIRPGTTHGAYLSGLRAAREITR